VKNGGGTVPDLLKLLSDNDIVVTDLSLSSPTLDDVFLKYTGRTIRDDEASGDEYGQAMRQWMGLSRR
jgi:ABC-2 type transport system ATP-binding protein